MSIKFLEKTILIKTDELVGILINLSKREEDYEEVFDKGLRKGQELIPLLMNFIDGNAGLIEPMLYQLITERLPSPVTMPSFGHLQKEINLLINELKLRNGISEEKKTETFLEEEIQAESVLSVEVYPELYKSMQKAFPYEEILTNVRIAGEFVDIYIPKMNLIVITEKSKSGYEKLKYFCKRHNNKLLQLPNNIVNDYRKILRYIK